MSQTSMNYKLKRLEHPLIEDDCEEDSALSIGYSLRLFSRKCCSGFPELVKTKTVSYHFGKNSTRDAKVKTVEEHELISVLVAAIKEQQTLIEKLRTDLQQIKSKVTIPE
jgi:hypothetical protein